MSDRRLPGTARGVGDVSCGSRSRQTLDFPGTIRTLASSVTATFGACLCITIGWCGLVDAQEVAKQTDINSYLATHCITCHGAEKQKADRRFDKLAMDLDTEQSLIQWQEILDAINRGEMPPEDKPRPATAKTKQFVAAVTERIEAAQNLQEVNDRAPFRRLNRFEYRNTIRDLLGVNIDSFDPTVLFPADERQHGFENIGKKLVLSDYLLQRYLEAASQCVAKAMQVDDAHEAISETFTPNDLCSRKFQFRPQIMFEVNVDGSYVDVGHGDRYSDRVNSKSFKGVPADGYYTIRVKAEAINRVHPYNPAILKIDPNEPIKMEVLVADPRMGGRLSGNPSDRSLAIIPLPDHEPTEYAFRTWMDKGFVPLLRYVNGPMPIKPILTAIASKYHTDVLPSNWRSGTDDEPAEPQERYLTDVYQGPRMRVHWIKIDGPESVAVEQNSRAIVLGEEAVTTNALNSYEVIKRILYRAFRRPPLESELDRYREFMDARTAMGESVDSALQSTLKAIMCSPNFLYVEKPSDGSESTNHSFKIASRLSYFLWSSMPDEELFEAASCGELSDPGLLLAQTERMLKDPKAKAFSAHFTDSWLRLNELGSMPPDTVKFKQFYDRPLQPMMKEETCLFFEDILTNNLSIEQFIDSNFTYLNRHLAKLYSIPSVEGDQFERVSLPAHSLRGGLLGHASILTATSNGVETSPVKRGIWVLENILGTPPAPPPPDVEPLEPDIRGATTIREQLAKHRKIETCAECHRKIDPIGFAMESFDPIGVLRTSYGNGEPTAASLLDTSGELASGEPFQNITDLKQLLLKRKDQFAHCLTEKMLTYALGRELNIQDRPQVDTISRELASRGYGLRDLVTLVVSSAVFQDK